MNSVSGRVLLYVVAGIAAGLLTWFVSDGSGFIRLPDSMRMTPRDAVNMQVVFMTWGGSIGVLLGVVDMLVRGQTAQWPKIVGIGLAVGIVSGVLGGSFAMPIFGALYHNQATTPFHFLGNVIARALGWAFIGALAGTAPGWRKLSVRVGRNGLIGGLIGGLLGGTVFEIVPYLMPGIPRPGMVARFFGFLITGALIGLFVALVQELLKEAWIRVVVGRNEGREILVEKADTSIGRAELSDVALFGDTNVAKKHAVLSVQPNGQFLLRDISAGPIGILVNGQKISGETIVRNGDQIQIASKLLVFYERMTKTRTVAAPKDVAAPRPHPASAVAASGGLPSLADLPQAGMGGGMGTTPYAPSSLSNGNGMQSAQGMGAIGGGFVATSGPYTGTAFALRPGATIGRDAQAGVPLPADSKASRLHARIVDWGGGGMAIEDAGSTNGTFVNGQRISAPQSLLPGDTVLIGTTALRFE